MEDLGQMVRPAVPADVRRQRPSIPGGEEHHGRDPRTCRRGHGRGDPGHHLVPHAGGGEGERLLPATPKDERVAALEAHDAAAVTQRPSVRHEQGVSGLLQRGAAGALTNYLRTPGWAVRKTIAASG